MNDKSKNKNYLAKRVFLVVLDSVGIGGAHDASLFNDEGSNTMKAISKSSKFNTPNLQKLGMYNIVDNELIPKSSNPFGAYARVEEKSMGKDTTVGHWEIAGLISDTPMPTYKNGFPSYIIDEFEKKTGHKTLCNKPYSGTDVIRDYGKQHEETGDLIVYTSADSVFQIAAHEDIVPVNELYKYCEIARAILKGKDAVGRVIARPFVGTYPNYERTANRHDYSLTPPRDTMLDVLKSNGFDVIGVGKISDIYGGKGITKSIKTKSNDDGMNVMSILQQQDFTGLCFVNLVDFDMKYGHRNDVGGYANALTQFDKFLGGFTKNMKNDDMLIITADHGCDPSTASTDHSRENVPLILYGNMITPKDYGVLNTYADIGATVLKVFNVEGDISGKSIL